MNTILILQEANGTGEDIRISVEKIISYRAHGHITEIMCGAGEAYYVTQSVAELDQALSELYYTVKRPGKVE